MPGLRAAHAAAGQALPALRVPLWVRLGFHHEASQRRVPVGRHGEGPGDIELGRELYSVFTIEEGKITRIEDYLRRDEALVAAGLG